MQRFLRLSALAMAVLITAAASLGPSSDKYFEILKNIEIFTNLYKELNTAYVDEIDPGKLMRTGLEAMVGSLDPYTNYIAESDIEGYRLQTEGRYNGIGAASEQIGEYITITEVYQGQPADKAGLKVGDRIVGVEGRDARGRTFDELQAIIRGAPGTTLQITVLRPGEKKELPISVLRADVDVPNVPYSGVVRDDVGYVALTTFTRDAAANVRRAISQLKAENPGLKGIILDLRGNGGGLLGEAVGIVNIFVPREEPVVFTRGKVKEWDRTYKTTSNPLDTDLPVAVLINKRSASASEIVSGALQDLDRAVLVGQRSYGKGLVQNVMDVGYKAKVKITTAKYYIPSQRCIQSVAYEDGEPIDIADDKRAKFKTRAGRTVLDGGGVAPDVELSAVTDEGIVKALVEQHLLFDYITQWTLQHPTIDSVADFRFTDFADFERYLRDRNFVYNSESEQLLARAMEAAEQEGTSVKADIKAVQDKLNTAQQNELRRHQEELIDLMEKEIVSRYYYQRGAIQMGLRNDKEISEAVRLLHDPAAYRKILSPR